MNLTHYYRDYTLSLEEQRVYDAISQGLHALQLSIPLPISPHADVQRVINAIVIDQPELFYFSQEGSSYSPSLVFHANYLYSPDEVHRKQEVMQKVVLNARKHTVGLPDIEKELRLHDYLVRAVHYDQQPIHPSSCYTVEGALLNGCAVCAGYSNAFKYLADGVGLSCMIVHGILQKNAESHVWNIVCVNGNCHHVDVTNDNYQNGFVSHLFFNLSDRQSALTHTPNNSVPYPPCPRSATILPLVTGTQELIQQLRLSVDCGKRACQVQLSKRFPSGSAVFDLIVRRIKPMDYAWYNQIRDYYYHPQLSVLTVYMKDTQD